MFVIVHHPDHSLDDIVYGPFATETAAMKWASDKWGIAGPWYWLPLSPPN